MPTLIAPQRPTRVQMPAKLSDHEATTRFEPWPTGSEGTQWLPDISRCLAKTKSSLREPMLKERPRLCTIRLKRSPAALHLFSHCVCVFPKSYRATTQRLVHVVQLESETQPSQRFQRSNSQWFGIQNALSRQPRLRLESWIRSVQRVQSVYAG